MFLFFHYDDESSSGLAGDLRGEGGLGSDVPRLRRCVGEYLYLFGSDEAEIERKSLGFVATVETCYIPSVSMTACKNNTLTRVATDEARLIPNGRQFSQELPYFSGLGEKTLRTVGEVL